MAGKFSEVSVYVLVLLWLCSSVKGDPDTTIVNCACNPATYNGGDPYMYSLQYVMKDLTTETPNGYGYNRYTQSPPPVAPSFGHAVCSIALSHDDCSKCLTKLLEQILFLCPGTVGAQLIFKDCQMRYENYLFT